MAYGINDLSILQQVPNWQPGAPGLQPIPNAPSGAAPPQDINSILQAYLGQLQSRPGGLAGMFLTPERPPDPWGNLSKALLAFSGGFGKALQDPRTQGSAFGAGAAAAGQTMLEEGERRLQEQAARPQQELQGLLTMAELAKAMRQDKGQLPELVELQQVRDALPVDDPRRKEIDMDIQRRIAPDPIAQPEIIDLQMRLAQLPQGDPMRGAIEQRIAKLTEKDKGPAPAHKQAVTLPDGSMGIFNPDTGAITPWQGGGAAGGAMIPGGGGDNKTLNAMFQLAQRASEGGKLTQAQLNSYRTMWGYLTQPKTEFDRVLNREVTITPAPPALPTPDQLEDGDYSALLGQSTGAAPAAQPGAAQPQGGVSVQSLGPTQEQQGKLTSLADLEASVIKLRDATQAATTGDKLLDPTTTANLESLANFVINNLAGLAQTGVIQPGEVPRLREMIGDPRSWTNITFPGAFQTRIGNLLAEIAQHRKSIQGAGAASAQQPAQNQPATLEDYFGN